MSTVFRRHWPYIPGFQIFQIDSHCASYLATIDTTSSSATTWLSPTRCGTCRALAPHTMAYLNVSLRVRWTRSQTLSMVELFRTISASEKSGSMPLLYIRVSLSSTLAMLGALNWSVATWAGLDEPLRVDAQKSQFLPAAVHDVLDPQVELAAHDHGLGLARELVEEVEADGVDLVVHIQAVTDGQPREPSSWHFEIEGTEGLAWEAQHLPFDVFPMVFHDHIDQVIHRG